MNIDWNTVWLVIRRKCRIWNDAGALMAGRSSRQGIAQKYTRESKRPCVYPSRRRRNFDFCRCPGELRWKQHSAPLQRPLVYFVRLDWFSLPPIPRAILSFSTPFASTLSGRHSMFVIEPGWARTESLRSVQPAGRPRFYILSLSILFPRVCSRHTIRYGLSYAWLSGLYAYSTFDLPRITLFH